MDSNIKENLILATQQEKLLTAEKKYEMKCIKTFYLSFFLALIILNILLLPFFLSGDGFILNELMQVEFVMFAVSIFLTFNLTSKPFIYYKHDFNNEVEQIKNMQM